MLLKKVQVVKAKNGGWFARIVAMNNNRVFVSETYKRKRDAIAAAEAVLIGDFMQSSIDIVEAA